MIRNNVPLSLLGGYLTGVIVTLLGVTYVDRQEPPDEVTQPAPQASEPVPEEWLTDPSDTWYVYCFNKDTGQIVAVSNRPDATCETMGVEP
jgi:hypothetical protein